MYLVYIMSEAAIMCMGTSSRDKFYHTRFETLSGEKRRCISPGITAIEGAFIIYFVPTPLSMVDLIELLYHQYSTQQDFLDFLLYCEFIIKMVLDFPAILNTVCQKYIF